MLIGPLAPRLDDLLRDIVSSLVKHLYLGKLRSKPLFLAPRMKLNIGALLPLFVSSYGYRIYFAILISLFLFLYLFGVIIKQPLLRPNDIYKFKALLPEDYCLIPGNGAIKLVGSRPNYILTSF